jgi:hypothetical protein
MWLGDKVTPGCCQPTIAGYRILVNSAISRFEGRDTDSSAWASSPCSSSVPLVYVITELGKGKRGGPTESSMPWGWYDSNLTAHWC